MNTPGWPRLLRDRAGAALVITLLMLTATLGICAVAVDTGMLYVAHAEVQRAADAAAMAAVSAYFDTGGSAAVDSARARAVDYAQRNAIARLTITPDDVTVTPQLDSQKVVVVVRSRAIPTFFGGVVGVPRVVVTGKAAARAGYTDGEQCVKPFAPPDPLKTPGMGSDYVLGQQLNVRGSWLVGGRLVTAYSWVMPDDPELVDGCSYSSNASTTSSATFRANICNCNMNRIWSRTDYDRVLPGDRNGPVKQGVEALVGLDPGAYWDVSRRMVAGSNTTPWQKGPRVVKVPVYDPATVSGGRFRYTRYVTVFIEGVDVTGDLVTARYVGGLRGIKLRN